MGGEDLFQDNQPGGRRRRPTTGSEWSTRVVLVDDLLERAFLSRHTKKMEGM
jgi:hypothetical protein